MSMDQAGEDQKDLSSTVQGTLSEVKRGKKRKLAEYVPREPRSFISAAREYGRIADGVVQSYIDELDAEIIRANQGVRYDASLDKRRRLDDDLQTSQIGATIWTADDKARLFNAIAIYGKDDIVSIAAALEADISPVQVREYLILLEDASIEYRRKVGPRRWKLMLSHDQSAAYEIDQGLVSKLEFAARAIEYRRRINEEVKEWEQIGSYWILDVPVSKQVRDAYARARMKRHHYLKQKFENFEHLDPTAIRLERLNSWNSLEVYENEEPILSTIPAARLLNLYNLLRLSSKFFMWNARPIHYDYGPSMRQTAFSDLQSLVISITRRIVSVVIFQTEIAVRAVPETANRRRLVGPRHVFTALDILDLPRNAHEFYSRLPRRYGVRVIDRERNPYETDEDNTLSIEEMEELLQQPVQKPWTPKERSDDVVKDEDDSDDSMTSEVDIKKSLDSLTSEAADNVEDTASGYSSSDDSDSDPTSTASTTSSQIIKAEPEDEIDSESLASPSSEEVFDFNKAGTNEGAAEADSDTSGSASLTRQELLSARDAMFDDSFPVSSAAVLERQLDLAHQLLDNEAAEEDYLEAQDQYESAHERSVLWKMLGQNGPQFAADETLEARAAEAQKQCTAYESRVLAASDDLMELTERVEDWRDHTDYVAQWEQVPTSPQSAVR